MRIDAIAGHGIHLRPKEQLDSVGELASVLVRPFSINGGSIQVAGCLFEDIPFCLIDRQGQASQLFDWEGRRIVDPELLGWLTANLVAIERMPARAFKQEWPLWSAKLKEAHEGHSVAESDLKFVWAKWAEGKVSASNGAATIATPFAGWVVPFVLGTQRVAPFSCPLTQKSGDELVSTVDGELTVRQSVERCVVSGKERVVTRLARCEATGEWASREYLVECPLSGRRVLAKALVRCGDCRELVAPQEVRQGVCQLCRSLAPIESGSWAAERIAQESGYEKFTWTFAESGTRAVFMGKRWCHRMRMVLELPKRQTIRRIESKWRGIWRVQVLPLAAA